MNARAPQHARKRMPGQPPAQPSKGKAMAARAYIRPGPYVEVPCPDCGEPNFFVSPDMLERFKAQDEAWFESVSLDGMPTFGYFATGHGGGPLISCVDSTFLLTPLPSPGPTSLLMLALPAARRRSTRRGA